MQEEGAIHKEIGQIMHQVTHKKGIACHEKALPLAGRQIVAEASPPYSIDDEECGVDKQPHAGRVPDEDVTKQIDLRIGSRVEPVSDALVEQRPLVRQGAIHVVLHLPRVPKHLCLQL